jgi:hypothetical protein
VKALLLPLGRIKAARFASFAERLQAEHVVQLRDISADGRPNRSKYNEDRGGLWAKSAISRIPKRRTGRKRQVREDGETDGGRLRHNTPCIDTPLLGT